jgi:hypothetical protein
VTFTVKDWKDRPFAPNVGESLLDYEARLAVYAAANPTLVTALDAAAIENLEARLSTYTDTVAPSAGQLAALPGTSGTPGAGNAYVTNSDARLFAISVKAAPYNAIGDGVTNDQAAIQAAITAANGRPVYFPPGTYRINTPLRLKPRTHLFGDNSPAWMYPEWATVTTRIIAGTGWSGPALLELYETSITGDGAPPNGCRIEGLHLHCNSLAARGVYWRGDARDTTLRDVEVSYATVAGFQAEGNGTNPSQEINWWHCHAGLGAGTGWLLQARCFDMRLAGCVSHTNGTDGFQVIGGTGGASSIEFANCRSEWNGGHGWLLYGPVGSSGIGKISLNGCVDDANEQNGIYVEHAIAGAGPVLINGHYGNRSGNNAGAGGRAGIRVHGCAQPVVIQAYAGRVGQNDGGTGIFRPTYGVDVTGVSACVAIGGYLTGTTAGYHTDGTGGQLVKGSFFTSVSNGVPTWTIL